MKAMKDLFWYINLIEIISDIFTCRISIQGTTKNKYIYHPFFVRFIIIKESVKELFYQNAVFQKP